MGYDKTMMPEGGSSKASLQPGDMVGQYRVVRLLGRGGMGEVYEVEHQVLHRRYALKLLPPDFAARPGALARFQREAEVMANLEHENIVQVDDFGETDGRYWLRMELANGIGIEGQQICSLQEFADYKGGKIDQALLADILTHVLNGLQYAHSKGAIHRDLKPANILFTTDKNGESTFKIADFGLVRLTGEDWVRSQAQISVQQSMSMGHERTMQQEGSSTRSMLGIYEYMSPEQKRGEEADERSDIYAIGVIAYRLLTGRNIGPKLPSRIDKRLSPVWDELVERTLEENPRDRVESASAALALLVKSQEQPEQEGEARKRKEAETARRQGEGKDRKRTPKKVEPVAGKDWTSPATGMEFVWVDALKCWVGKYEVTNAEYRKKESGHDSKEYKGHSLNGPRQPVVYVNFDDAKEYAEWLTQRDQEKLAGMRYRVPGEDEWMAFAQCGDGRKYPWGDNWPPKSGQAGNYAGEETKAPFGWDGIGGYRDGHLVTCDVEESWANPWGLYGVGGNVWECCSEDKRGSSFGAWRGASWYRFSQDSLRCSFRRVGLGSFRFSFGFRLLLSR
jgi:serine/threonine-protein kinase